MSNGGERPKVDRNALGTRSNEFGAEQDEVLSGLSTIVTMSTDPGTETSLSPADY
jgi:hypothetical protein